MAKNKKGKKKFFMWTPMWVDDFVNFMRRPYNPLTTADYDAIHLSGVDEEKEAAKEAKVAANNKKEKAAKTFEAIKTDGQSVEVEVG